MALQIGVMGFDLLVPDGDGLSSAPSSVTLSDCATAARFLPERRKCLSARERRFVSRARSHPLR